MGLFDRFRRIKDPVRGMAQVVSVGAATQQGSTGTCRAHLMITVPGHPTFSVTEELTVPVAKWPGPGALLPVEASQAEPTRFRILWDDVQPWSEPVTAQEGAPAERTNPSAVPPAPPVTTGSATTTHTTIVVNGRAATPAEVQAFEARVGMDLDGDGTVAGDPASTGQGPGSFISRAMAMAEAALPPVPNPPPPDRIGALERLTALRDSGALTQAEFEAEKARLLSS